MDDPSSLANQISSMGLNDALTANSILASLIAQSPMLSSTSSGLDVLALIAAALLRASTTETSDNSTTETHENPFANSNDRLECGHCTRTFKRADVLLRHRRLHTGERPFACLKCNRQFSRSDHLLAHQRRHAGEKPYHCTQCPFATHRRDILTRHYTGRHKMKPTTSG